MFQKIRNGLRRLLCPELYVERGTYERMKRLLRCEIASLRKRNADLKVQLRHNTHMGLLERAQVFRDLNEMESAIEKHGRALATEMTASLQERIRELETLNRGLMECAAKDPLTGLTNRHGLALQFETAYGGLMRELKTSPRSDICISAIVCDIDHFKRINDAYGHVAGDQVLVEMARRIRQYLGRRAEDAMGYVHARIGGEEFVVILPHADGENAYKQTILFLSEVRKTPFLVNVQGVENDVWLTISAGVATLQLTTDMLLGTPEQRYQRLYEEADAALYQAKETGRDRVIRYQPGM